MQISPMWDLERRSILLWTSGLWHSACSFTFNQMRRHSRNRGGVSWWRWRLCCICGCIRQQLLCTCEDWAVARLLLWAKAAAIACLPASAAAVYLVKKRPYGLRASLSRLNDSFSRTVTGWKQGWGFWGFFCLAPWWPLVSSYFCFVAHSRRCGLSNFFFFFLALRRQCFIFSHNYFSTSHASGP